MSNNNIKKNKVSKYIMLNSRYRTEKPLFAENIFANVFAPGGKVSSSGGLSSTIGTVANGLGAIISAGVDNAKLKDTSNIESTIKDYEAAPIELSSREGLLNQWTTEGPLKTNYNPWTFTASNEERAMNILNGTVSGATAGADVAGASAGPWGALIGGLLGISSGYAGVFIGDEQAKQRAASLNAMAKEANRQRNRKFTQAANLLDQQDFMLNMQNYAALGGPLTNMFAEGGSLSRTHGSDFTNGALYINEGGTHEENPNEGVQIGIDQEGNPNLVEEGEVVFNDYVYSNRLYAKGGDLARYNLPEKYDGYTFARIATELFKESEESPNDPISLETLKVTADRLRGLQEEIRESVEDENANKFDSGGFINKNNGKWSINSQEVEREAKRKASKVSTDENSPAYKKAYAEALASLNAKLNATIKEHNEAYQKQTADLIEFDRVKKELQDLGYSDRYIEGLILSGGTGSGPGKFKPEAYDLLNSHKNPEESYNPANESLNEQKPLQPSTKSVQPDYDSPDYKFDIDPVIVTANRKPNKVAPKSLAPRGHTKETKEPLKPVKIDPNKEPQQGPLEYKRDNSLRGKPPVQPRYKEPFDWNGFGNDVLRYAPLLGNLIGLFGNEKDYSDVNTFEADTRNPRSVRFSPIGGYYTPNYVSPYEMENPILQGAANTRRLLANNSLGNSVTAQNALIASDLQTQGLIGQALLQGKEYNNAQRQKAAEFRRGIDQYNSTGDLQAQTTNMNLNDYFYNRALSKYNMRNAIDMAYNQARSANATALFNNLGNIGRENVVWNMANNNPALAWALMRDGNYRYKGV